MAGDVMDRRVRKTRGTLRACLTKLLKEKKIKEISVKEISEMADINRGTFYLHYRDVFDLLESIENDLFRQFTEILDRHGSDEVIESPEKLLADILTFIRENADLTMILLGPNGDIRFLTRIRGVFREKITDPLARELRRNKKLDTRYWEPFVTEGALGIVKVWLENGADLTPAELASLIADYVRHGASPASAK